MEENFLACALVHHMLAFYTRWAACIVLSNREGVTECIILHSQ